MLQEGSSIEIAAVISGHIAAAPPSERGLCVSRLREVELTISFEVRSELTFSRRGRCAYACLVDLTWLVGARSRASRFN
jgi:hypothetical protein